MLYLRHDRLSMTTAAHCQRGVAHGIVEEESMKLRLPWQKAPAPSQPASTGPAACTHPHVDVEMHGTVIKRRWCTVCGQDLPVADRSHGD
jgi:hypothetical protein